MKNLLSYIGRLLCLSVTALFVTSTLHAQNLYVKVGQTYGISASDDHKRVSEKWGAGQDTLTLYYAWQRWKAEGMSLQTFRSRYVGCAVAKDIAWRYESADNIKKGFQNTYAFADWTDASGHWYANATMQIPRGGMVGQGSFGFYDDSNTSQVFATCEFEMTEDWWPAGQTERRLFEAPNSSLSTPDNGSYNESFRIEGFRLQGPTIYGDGINRIGMFIRRPGECSYMNQVFAYNFQHGIVIAGAVPFTFGTLSAFFCEKIGVALYGGWGSTFAGQTISGDGNGELFGAHPGYGDEGGGIISFSLGKNEDGIHGNTPDHPWRGQILAYIEGQYAADIRVANISRNQLISDAAFVVNPRLKDGSLQASILEVGPHKGYNYRTTLHNLATGKRWAAPENGANRIPALKFTHYAEGDRMVINDLPSVAGTDCKCPPLGWIPNDGVSKFDYMACTPKRDGATYTPPVTPPPTPTDPPVTPPSSGLVLSTVPTMTDAMVGVDHAGPHPLALAVDGNSATYFLWKRPMTAGDEIIVELPAYRTVKGITLEIAQGYPNSYPLRFSVHTAGSGSFTRRTPSTHVAGSYPSCTASFQGVSNVKRVKIRIEEGNGGNWLAVAAISVQ